jgi:serine/threonine protein kinase
MSSQQLKIGSFSYILGKNIYMSFTPVQRFKLLKLVKPDDTYDEFKHISLVRQIENYQKYYCIPEDESKLLSTEDDFYKKLVKLVQERKLTMLSGPFQCHYIDYAGDKDLQQSIVSLREPLDFKYWKSYKKILKFVKNIMTAIQLLHNQKLCHLDIKPENIMVNTTMETYKLIDFGFTSLEPFDDYVSNMIDKTDYITRFFNGGVFSEFMPKVEANDLVLECGKYPMETDRSLVYKIDSYCLGRTLLLLKTQYKEHKTYYCYNGETTAETKLDTIIGSLLESDCRKRPTIQECLEKYF